MTEDAYKSLYHYHIVDDAEPFNCSNCKSMHTIKFRDGNILQCSDYQPQIHCDKNGCCDNHSQYPIYRVGNRKFTKIDYNAKSGDTVYLTRPVNIDGGNYRESDRLNYRHPLRLLKIKDHNHIHGCDRNVIAELSDGTWQFVWNVYKEIIEEI